MLLGEFAFVGPNATLLGRCGSATARTSAPTRSAAKRSSIGDYALIGIGSVVVSDVAADAVVAGNPARTLT